MKVNKLIPLSLVTLLGAGGLVGCGGGGGGGGDKVGKEVIVWATADEEQVLNEAVRVYNEGKQNDDEKIYITYSAVQEGDAGAELLKNPTADSAADLVLIADDHVYNLASNGTIANLTSVIGDEVKNNHVDNAVKGVTYDDKIYGAPISNDNGYFLYYNKKYVSDEQAGSLEKLFEAASAAKKKINIDWGTGYYDVMPFVGPAGGKLSWSVKSSGVKYDINWDSEELVARAKKLSDLVVANKDYFATGDDDYAAEHFKDETVIATVRGTWAYDNLKNAIGEENLKAAKLPTFDGKQMGSFTGSKLYAINGLKGGDEGAERRGRAIELMKVLTNKELQLFRFEKRNTIPSRKDAQGDSRYKDHTNITIDALNAQNAAASIIQSQSAEGNYWTVGGVIGKAITTGNYGEDYTSWQEFMTAECKILRKD